MVTNGNKPDSQKRECVFEIGTKRNVVPRKAGKIFYNNAGNKTASRPGQHALQGGAGQGCAGEAVVYVNAVFDTIGFCLCTF